MSPPPSWSHPTTPTATSATVTGGLWSDLPRRVAVLVIGIPLVGIVLMRPFTSWLFFQGVHLVSSWEWLVLVPSSSPGNNNSSDNNRNDKKKTDGDEPNHSQRESSSSSMTKDSSSFSLSMYLFPVMSCILANVASNNNNKRQELFAFGLVATACLFCLLENRRPDVGNHLVKGLLFLTIPMQAWNIACKDFETTAFLLSVVWNCDTGALLVGRCSKALRGKRCIPVPQWLQQMSPAKSIEGILGGLLFGGLTSLGWPFLRKGLVWLLQVVQSSDTLEEAVSVTDQYSSIDRLWLGLILSLLGIVGDLWESCTKRQGGVKDSGKLLPGHGGVLDRFDSSLLPVLFYVYYSN